MTLSSNDRLTNVRHELEALRAELAQVRNQQTQRTTAHRWRLRIGLLAAPLIVVMSWAWSAQSADPTLLAIEKRLGVLETLIRKGPTSTQVTGPLEVLGPDGLLLLVGGRGGHGRVDINSGDKGGEIKVISDNNKVFGGMSIFEVGKSGKVGSVYVFDEGGGEAVMDGWEGGELRISKPAGHIVVGNKELSKGGGGQQVAIWSELGQGGKIRIQSHKQVDVVKLGVMEDNIDAGAMTIVNPAGNIVVGDSTKPATVAIFSQPGEGGRIRFWSKAGGLVAGLGAFKEQDGIIGQMTVADAQGRNRATMTADGGGAHMVMNEKEEDAAGITMTPNGPQVVVFGQDGDDPVAIMEAEPGKGGKIRIQSPEGVNLAGLEAKDEKYGFVYVSDKEGKKQAFVSGRTGIGHEGGEVLVRGKNGGAAGITTSPEGSAQVAVFNEDITKTVTIEDEPRGGGAIIIRNHAGTEVAGMVADPELEGEVGMVSVADENGKFRAFMTGADGGEISVYDENERDFAGLIMSSEGRPRVAVVSDGDKNMAIMEGDGEGGQLLVLNSGGKPVAGLRSGRKGGEVIASNSEGKPVAAMGGEGFLDVYNQDGLTVATLRKIGGGTGGVLQIVNKTGVEGGLSSTLEAGILRLADQGSATVEAGTLPDGRGVVRAFPNSGCAPVGTVLFKATKNNCIIGEK